MRTKTNFKLSGVAGILVVSGFLLAGCQKAALAPAPEAGVVTPVIDASQSMPATDEAIVGQGGVEQKIAVTEITIANMQFAPTSITVKAGSTVSVTNTDTSGHSVSSDDGTSFDTGIISQNETATFVAPSESGTYTYHCTPHPMMKGTLIVE